MRIYISLCLIAFLLLGTPLANAQTELPDSEAKKVLQSANGQEYIPLPVGEIRIKNGMNPDQSSSPKNRVFGGNMHSLLKVFSGPLGLVTVEDITGKKGFQVEYRFVVVRGTQKLSQISNKLDQYGIMALHIGDRTFGDIVKNINYSAPGLNPADDYRLVMGKYTYQPTALGREFFAATGKPLANEYKFKALLKSDPFNKTHRLSAFDWGYVDRDTWETRSIP